MGQKDRSIVCMCLQGLSMLLWGLAQLKLQPPPQGPLLAAAAAHTEQNIEEYGAQVQHAAHAPAASMSSPPARPSIPCPLIAIQTWSGKIVQPAIVVERGNARLLCAEAL